jgi:DNA invertase Pin-like site-specific DNA recombinase
MGREKEDLSAKLCWRDYWERNHSFAEMAKEYGVSVTTLQRRFIEWGFPIRRRGPRRAVLEEGDLTDAAIREILKADAAGVSQSEQARIRGVSRQRIHQILRGERRMLRGEL